MPEPREVKTRYIAGLDGLRAIALLAVIAYHLNLSFASGGFLGVEIFFVLSGYLVTHLLLIQREQRTSIHLKNFWMRRLRRLLPALLLMLIGTIVYMTFTAGDRIATFRGDVISALFYANNWYLLFHHVSYFESFANPSPFLHLWSLAVEGQFYVLWPLLVMLGLRFTPKRWQFAAWTFGLAVISALLMAWLYDPAADPSRVYYGTDTRIFALLIGALIAIIQPQRTSSSTSPRSMLGIHIVGTVGLMILCYLIGTIDEYSEFLYRGGFVLLSVGTAMLIVAIVQPGSFFNRILSFKPLQWIGLRSYGIYLWHYPIIVLTTPLVNTNGFSWIRALLQVAASLLFAELSWRYIETPIRKGLLPGFFKPITKLKWDARRLTLQQWMSVGCTALVIAIFCYGMIANKPLASAHHTSLLEGTADPKQSAESTADQNLPASRQHPDPDSSSSSSSEQGISKGQEDASTVQDYASSVSTLPSAKPQHPNPSDRKSAAASQAQEGGSVNKEANKEGRAQPDSAGEDADEAATASSSLKGPSGWNITAVGDSVMLDTSPYLEKLLPGITVDAEIGRQMSSAREVLQDYKESGKLGNGVIIALGTNGAFNSKQFRAMLDALDEREIILVNTRVPRKWEDRVNDTLDEIAEEKSNVTLVDWYAASSNHDSYFSPDGVHLEAEGAKAYAELVAGCIKSLSP